MLINSFVECAPTELQKYRLPNLVASFAKRLKLATMRQQDPKMPHTRIIISDFSKKPTQSERLFSENYGNLAKNLKGNRKSSKKKNSRIIRDSEDHLKRKSISNKRTSYKIESRKTSYASSDSKFTSSKTIPLIDSSLENRESFLVNSRKQAPNSSKRSKFISPFQLYTNNSSFAALKTKVKLKEFSKTVNYESFSTARAKQLKVVDDLMIALKDTQISRKTLEHALLIPEDVIRPKTKLSSTSFEYIRSWIPEATLKAHQQRVATSHTLRMKSDKLQVSRQKDTFLDLPKVDYIPSKQEESIVIITPQIQRTDLKSPIPKVLLVPQINQIEKRHKSIKSTIIDRKVDSKVPRHLNQIEKRHKSIKSAIIGRKVDSKVPRHLNPKVIPTKLKKSNTVSPAKMLVKPMSLNHYDSDPSLNKGEKARITCWWNFTELKKLRSKLMEKQESDRLIKMESTNDKKNSGQGNRQNSHIPHKTTKYMKSPSSIDQLPIEPHLNRQYIIDTQASAQGATHFRNSISLQTHQPSSRPKTASLFHNGNTPNLIHRRRSISVGNYSGDSHSVEPSRAYLQIYAPRQYLNLS